MSDVTARIARNRRAGARWQRDLRDGLRSAGFDVERLVLAGREDEGDLVVRLPELYWPPPERFLVIEAKAGEMHPAQFVKEAQREALNYANHRCLPPENVPGIAVVKRRGANWKDAYVLTTLGEFLYLLT